MTITTTQEQTALTSAEQRRLQEFETTIERGLQTFYEVGYALAEIREQRLYRAEYGTFEDYCVERWKMRRAQANRLITASEVMENLDPIGSKPTNEAQTRPLAKLPAEEQGPAWEEAVERSGGKPTARHVEEVVKERTEPPATEPQRPDLPPGWYWQNSSNPADIIAINRENASQTSGFCETHEQAAAAAWQVHLDGQRKPEPQYQRMNVRDVEKLGLIAGLDRDVALEMQRRGYFWGYYEKDDKGIVYSVYHHQGYRYRILLSNIPAFINQQPGHEALMMGVDVDAPAPTKQNYWQRIADLPAEQRNEMIERLESLGHDVQYIERTGELRNNLKGSAGHNTETIKLVSELEKRLEIAQENWDRHQQQIAERERIKQPELPEQQPVAHPTIRQCMIDAYRLIQAGDKERAHLQAQRFRVYPDIAGIIGHAIWGMQCAMEEDSDE
jgi:hypothetical protein